MSNKKAQPPDPKSEALRGHGCLHPHPERVTAPLFDASDFFDPRDLVQVKYEMLRRVRVDGSPIREVAAVFGFSRPAYYQAQSSFERGGLLGLLPKKTGPQGAHKLNDRVVDFLRALLSEEPTLGSAELADRVLSHFELRVHPRSVERALARSKKKLR